MTPDERKQLRSFQNASLMAYKVGNLIADAHDEGDKVLRIFARLRKQGYDFPLNERTLDKQLKILENTVRSLEKAFNMHDKAGFKRVRLTRI